MKYSIITSAYNQLSMLKKTYSAVMAQTYKDLEWIVTDDGSTDGTSEWVKSLPNVKYFWQENKGYRLSHILNAAAKMAEGEVLVFVMGDSYPKEDFLEQFDKVWKPERVVNGMRMNLGPDDTVVSPDWRTQSFYMGDPDDDETRVIIQQPWRAMTLNSAGMGKKLWEKIGGMCEEYHLYGKEDWDLFMRAFFDGAELWWANKAVVYHHDHPGKEDSQANTDLFNERVALFDPANRTREKMEEMESPAHIEAKKRQIREHMQEIERNERLAEKEDRQG